METRDMGEPRSRILVAMSGGVDSSVAAALLVEAGHDVVGITLRLRPCGTALDTGSCCGLGELDSARAVADLLGISHYVWDVADIFEAEVLRPSWQDYDAGRTPNPCIQCNARVKLPALCERAPALGAQAVATGHYARVVTDSLGQVSLHRGVDPGKDQSYFLYRIHEAHRSAPLSMVRFPLGELTKVQVRTQAIRLGLPCAARPESQDACFVSEDGSFAEALRQRFGAPIRPGPLLAPDGREVGRHEGIHRFTLGQRRGTGVALGQRAYVAAIDPGTAWVTLATDPAHLKVSGLEVAQVLWHGPPPPVPWTCGVQVRYRSQAVEATLVARDNARARLRFTTPQAAVTPGQAAVFYQGDRVAGGGPIQCTFSD